MESVFIQVVILLSFAYPAAAQERNAYLKLEQGDPAVTVFSKPGVSWSNCIKNARGECVDAMGSLDQNSRVWVTGPKVMTMVLNPLTNRMEPAEFYPVQFEYSRMVKDQNGVERLVARVKGPIGYVDAARLDFERRNPLYSAPILPPAQACSLNSVPDLKRLNDLACAIVTKNIELVAEQLTPHVGFCADKKDDKNKNKNIYDNVILPRLLGTNLPNARGENNRPITTDQLINIDALARTMVGELSGCFKAGLEYPMAMARIALNREAAGQDALYIRDSHDSRKPRLARVLTSPTQFNNWARRSPANDITLCPPRQAGQRLASGRNPNPEELAIWNHAMKIATEAVLFPNSFQKRTANLREVRYFTSGRSSFFNFRKVKTSIEGRPIDNPRCMALWVQ